MQDHSKTELEFLGVTELEEEAMAGLTTFEFTKSEIEKLAALVATVSKDDDCYNLGAKFEDLLGTEKFESVMEDLYVFQEEVVEGSHILPVKKFGMYNNGYSLCFKSSIMKDLE